MLQEEYNIESNSDLRGIKIAEVVSNLDPKAQERILVRVIGVHNMENKTKDNAVWAHHCSPFRSASGDLPVEGDYVFVVFPNPANPMFIIWLGFVRSSFQDGNEGSDDTTPPPTNILGEPIEE